MGDREFDTKIQEECRQELQKILYYIEEYNKGDEQAEDELLTLLATYKKDMKFARKYHIIFSLLIFYLDKSIMLTNNGLRQESDYQSLIGYCREDIKYYLEVSKILKKHISDCIKADDYEAVDVVFLLTVKMGYVLNNITEYFSYIKNMENYANTFIQYQIPGNFRDSGRDNIQEIEKALKVLGLREENV